MFKERHTFERDGVKYECISEARGRPAGGGHNGAASDSVWYVTADGKEVAAMPATFHEFDSPESQAEFEDAIVRDAMGAEG